MYLYGMYLFESKRLFYEYFRLLNLLNKKFMKCTSNFLVLQDVFSCVKKKKKEQIKLIKLLKLHPFRDTLAYWLKWIHHSLELS
jgi:hypothetical protein